MNRCPRSCPTNPPAAPRPPRTSSHWFLAASQKSPVVAALQSAMPQVQVAAFAITPLVAEQGTKSHRLSEAKQKSPVVAASQSVVPHAQLAGLAVAPSVAAQVMKRHRLTSAKQKNPVPDQQSTEPHLQTSPFSEAPLPTEQAAAWLQVLEEDVQTSPVADVQAPEAPQTQGAGLAVAPLVWGQAGPVKAHRQALEQE